MELTFNYKKVLNVFLLTSNSVCSPTVRIIAFQAIDPGSTPGKRKLVFSFFNTY